MVPQGQPRPFNYQQHAAELRLATRQRDNTGIMHEPLKGQCLPGTDDVRRSTHVRLLESSKDG